MTHLRVELARNVTTVTIDRSPVNALTVELCRHITETFSGFDESSEARCILLSGAGSRAFCAGLDFREFFASTDDEAARATVVREMYAAIYHCRVPVIAVVEGPALGAGSVIASVCDIRVASTAASFGLPEVNVGRIGGAAHHGRLLPQGMLRRMVFTGTPISSAEAYRVGLVDELVSGDAMRVAKDLATVIAEKSIVGLRHAKESLNEIEHLAADEGYIQEQQRSAQLRKTDDAQEASRAVIEKRAPVFKGR